MARTRTPPRRPQLSHDTFKSLLDYRRSAAARSRSIRALVAQARSTIRQASIPRIMYGRAQAQLRRRRRARACGSTSRRRRRRAGAQAQERRQPVGARAEPVPTGRVQGGHRHAHAELVKQFATTAGSGAKADSPSVESGRSSPLTSRISTSAITSRPGTAILNDLELVPFPTVQQTRRARSTLAGPTSPLRGLLRLVVDNTSLVELPDQQSAAASSQPPGQDCRRTREGSSIGAAGSWRLDRRAGRAGDGALPADPTAHGRRAGRGADRSSSRPDCAAPAATKSLGPDVGGADPLEALSQSRPEAARLQVAAGRKRALPPCFGSTGGADRPTALKAA